MTFEGTSGRLRPKWVNINLTLWILGGGGEVRMVCDRIFNVVGFTVLRKFVSQGGSEKEDTQRPDPSALPPLAFKRDRGHTISVMSPVRKPRIDWNFVHKDSSPRGKDAPRSGINPR